MLLGDQWVEIFFEGVFLFYATFLYSFTPLLWWFCHRRLKAQILIWWIPLADSPKFWENSVWPISLNSDKVRGIDQRFAESAKDQFLFLIKNKQTPHFLPSKRYLMKVKIRMLLQKKNIILLLWRCSEATGSLWESDESFWEPVESFLESIRESIESFWESIGSLFHQVLLSIPYFRE